MSHELEKEKWIHFEKHCLRLRLRGGHPRQNTVLYNVGSKEKGRFLLRTISDHVRPPHEVQDVPVRLTPPAGLCAGSYHPHFIHEGT